MIPRVLNAEYIDGHSVFVTFKNGTTGEVDFEGELDGPIFAPLMDHAYFRRFHIEGHTLAWDNGADFSPEFVYDNLIAATPAGN